MSIDSYLKSRAEELRGLALSKEGTDMYLVIDSLARMYESRNKNSKDNMVLADSSKNFYNTIRFIEEYLLDNNRDNDYLESRINLLEELPGIGKGNSFGFLIFYNLLSGNIKKKDDKKDEYACVNDIENIVIHEEIRKMTGKPA